MTALRSADVSRSHRAKAARGMVLNLDSAGMLATSGTTAQPSRSLQSIPAMLDLDAEFLTLFDRLECHSQRRQDQHPPKRLLKVKKEGWHP